MVLLGAHLIVAMQQQHCEGLADALALAQSSVTYTSLESDLLTSKSGANSESKLQ